MLTITATEISDRRVRLSITTDETGTMTVWRVHAGASTAVLGGVDIPTEGTVLDDATPPLGRPCTWTAITSEGSSATTEALEIRADSTCLSDPWAGESADVHLVDRSEREFGGRAEAIEIEGAYAPIIISDTETAPVGSLTVLTRTADDAATLRVMARRGTPLLLRHAVPGLDDVWIQALSGRKERRLAAWTSAVKHSWGSVIETGPGARLYLRARSDTLGDLDDAVGGTTLGEIADRWATLGEIAETDLRAA